MFEIHDQTKLKTADFQIIDHLATLVVCNHLYGLRVNHDAFITNQVWHIDPDRGRLVDDIEFFLLFTWDPSQIEFNDESPLIYLLVEAMPDLVENLYAAADDLVNFFAKKDFSHMINRKTMPLERVKTASWSSDHCFPLRPIASQEPSISTQNLFAVTGRELRSGL